MLNYFRLFNDNKHYKKLSCCRMTAQHTMRRSGLALNKCQSGLSQTVRHA